MEPGRRCTSAMIALEASFSVFTAPTRITRHFHSIGFAPGPQVPMRTLRGSLRTRGGSYFASDTTGIPALSVHTFMKRMSCTRTASTKCIFHFADAPELDSLGNNVWITISSPARTKRSDQSSHLRLWTYFMQPISSQRLHRGISTRHLCA